MQGAKMEIREAINSEWAKKMGTEDLRNAFLVEKVFIVGEMTAIYSHVDRMIIGGIVPTSVPLALPVSKELGTEFFFRATRDRNYKYRGRGVCRGRWYYP